MPHTVRQPSGQTPRLLQADDTRKRKGKVTICTLITALSWRIFMSEEELDFLFPRAPLLQMFIHHVFKRDRSLYRHTEVNEIGEKMISSNYLCDRMCRSNAKSVEKYTFIHLPTIIKLAIEIYFCLIYMGNILLKTINPGFILCLCFFYWLLSVKEKCAQHYVSHVLACLCLSSKRWYSQSNWDVWAFFKSMALREKQTETKTERFWEQLAALSGTSPMGLHYVG